MNKGKTSFLNKIKPVRELRNLGFVNWLTYEYHKKRQNRGIGGNELKRLSSRTLAYPVYFRPGTSDLYVFRQVFGDREYGCLDDCLEPKLIIDCGANVGYTSAYFLSRFPSATVIAVEPDAENCSLALRNLAPYRGRFSLIKAGVWSSQTYLTITRESCGHGKEWGRCVRPAREGEDSSIKAIDIGTLLKESRWQVISILKIDVEGSETAIFTDNYRSWIERVENLIIELHGKHCEDTFFRAIKGIPFVVSKNGELTICRKRSIRD
ncbi:MAG TPA: FkbM family methyltransferase [Thermodesulfovibrionales bacterium]|nr:FkbM family methyltransferase [Thermodesulfovibrionales bacterium]